MSYLLALAVFISAQRAGVSLTAEFGWDGIYRADFDTPVLVTITNEGPEILGAVVLRWASPATGQPPNVSWRDLRDALGPAYRIPVAIPEKSTLVHTAYVQASEWRLKSLWVFLLDRRGRTLAAYELMGVNLGRLQPLVGIVGEKIPEGLRRASPGNVVVARVSPAELPDRWHGFACLDGLVWMDGDAATIRTPEQAEALRLWVASGGHLVVARSHGIGVAETFLADLLPAEIGAAVEHSTFASLGAFAGADPPVEQTALVLEARARGGRVLAAEGDLPLVLQRRYGRGRITLVAFDPSGEPFASWEGSGLFWRAILDLPSKEPPPADQQAAVLDDSMRLLGSTRLDQLAGSFEGVRPPSLDWLFYLLALYIVLIGPVDYFVLRRLKRLEWTWITLAVYTLAFTGITLAAGARLSRPALMLQEMAVVDVYPDAGAVRGWTVAGALSPRPAEMEVRVNAPHVRLAGVPIVSSSVRQYRPYGAYSGTQDEPVILQGADAAVEEWTFQRGETRGMLAEWCGPSAAPVSFELGAANVVVTNDSGAAITDTVLLTPAGVYDLGAIPPGRHERPLPPPISVATFMQARVESALGLSPASQDEYPYPSRYYAGYEPLAQGQRRLEVRKTLLGISLAPGREPAEPRTQANPSRWSSYRSPQHVGVPQPRDRLGVARSMYVGDWVARGGSVLLGWWESGGYIELSDRRPVRSAEVLIRVFGRE